MILWPDTFTNHFHPEIGQAGVEVLESAGYRVLVPQKPLCCGRPLYDFGMLDTAKHMLREILDSLRSEIEAGIPIVGLEPSCVAVFRDELIGLFPNDKNAQRLKSQTFLLSEFLNKHVKNYKPPPLRRKALVHGHCHHKSLMGLDDEEAILKKLGLEFELPESGCCGMAGSFGFERGEHYEVSVACGERVLLPAVRNAKKDTLIIADGFSCQEQIAQTTDRRAAAFGPSHSNGFARWPRRFASRLSRGRILSGQFSIKVRVATRARVWLRRHSGGSRPWVGA